MGISSPGIGSNLDVNGIVTKLMSVEQRPITLLDTKTTSFKAKLSGFGTLKSLLAQFQTSVSALANVSKFQNVNTSVGDASVATAAGSSIAVPGSYSLEVSKLAQAQKLNAVGQASSTAAIGSGTATTLSFDFGTIAAGAFNAGTGKYAGSSFTSAGTGIKTVTIDATNNSLSGIRDAVNAAGVGVTATIVNDGSNTPYRLSLTVNATGLASSLKLSVAGDATLSSLLSHDPGADSGQALTETSAAQNAQFKLDGIDVTKASNTVTDALPGVTLNLTKTNVGAATSIAVTRDTASVVTAVNTFATAYNNITQALKDATAYDPTTRTGAILNGEASVLTIQNQIRSILSAPIGGSATPTASTFTLLSQVGVSFQSTGLLAVDSTKLQAAANTNFSKIAGLFSNVGSSSDALVTYNTATSKTAAGAYPINITQLATKGTSTAASAAGLTITTGVNDVVSIKLNGISSDVTLAAGTYASAAALATELQSKVNGNSAFFGTTVVVDESAGVLSITSAAYGSTSHAEVYGGNGQANLKFDTGATVTDGTNVAGTINGVAGIGIGQTLTGASGDKAEGLSLEITGGGLGSRGTVDYSQGYAYQLNTLATSLLGTGGPIAARTDGLNASIKENAKNRDIISARLVGIEARYRAQFTALDTLISSMSTTSSFLTQQLAALAK